MICPRCEYDISNIYAKVLNSGEKSKYCKIRVKGQTENGYIWSVNCTCPRCNTQFTFFDGDKYD